MDLRQRYDWEGFVTIRGYRHKVGIDDCGSYVEVYTSAQCGECGSKSWIDSTNRDGSSIECAECGNVEPVKNVTQHYLQGVK